MEWKLHEFHQFFKKVRNSFLLISVLPCFSKLLERIMYNKLYKYLLQNNLFYEKQCGFQASNSTEHAVVQLISQILDAFNENKYTLGIFIDLYKAFDTVDHDILLKKLDMCRNKLKMASQLFNKQKTIYKISWPAYWFRNFTMWCTAGFHTRTILLFLKLLAELLIFS